MSTTTHIYPLPGLRTTATYLDFFFAYHFDLLLCADTTMSTTTHNYPLPGLRTTASYLDFFFAYHFDLCDHDQRCQRIPVRYHHHHGSLPGSNIPPHSLFWNPIYTKIILAT